MPIDTQVICMNKKKYHPGPLSTLKTNQAEMRDTWMSINAKMAWLEATRINNSICNKNKYARKSIVERFLRSNAFTYCKGTHDSQRANSESNSGHLTFLILFIPLSIKHIIFQDLYTTVTNQEFFHLNIKITLDKQDAKTVSICLNNVDTKQITLISTIYGNGHKLKPVLVFKQKPGDRIDCDLTPFQDVCHYYVQEKA